jgi:large subunit ribosomal protein L2
MHVGQKIQAGPKAENVTGNTVPLSDIPEGVAIFNIEGIPGDGGRYARASGTAARIVSKYPDKIVVILPSKKKKDFNPNCRAIIGTVAGGGRPEKPFLKAGTRHFRMKAKNKLYPNISGAAQNAVDHPFGNKRTLRKSKARPCSRNAPPGRKVGMIAARRTGRKK